jgi:hypothetical protein
MQIDPLGKLVDHRLVSIFSDGDPSVPTYKSFERDYLQAGQRHSVSSGGAPAGLITLQGYEPDYRFNVVKYVAPPVFTAS